MTPRHRDILENAVCLAALTVLAFVAFGPEWWAGQVPFSADYIFTQAPWREAAPSDLSDTAATLSKAQALRYYPWYRFISDSAQRHDSSLWYPLEGGGVPFLAVWRTRCLSPFTVPFHLFSLPAALRLSALLKVLVAGWSAFYVGKRFRLRAPLALLAAAAFQVGGAAYVRTAAPISDVVPWLPLLVLFGEQLASGYRRTWPFGALVWALMLFGGDPEAAVACVLFFLLYLALRYAFDAPAARTMALGFGTAVSSLLLGAALAALQIVPFVELAFHASALPEGPAHASLAWTDLLLLVFPRFLDTSSSDAARQEALPLLHAGAVSAVMLAVWLSVRRFAQQPAKARADALICAAAALTALLAGQRLPLVSKLGTEDYLLADSLAFGLVGAAAGEQWLTMNARQCVASIPRFLLGLALGVALFAGLLLAASLAGTSGVRPTVSGVLLALALTAAALTLLGVTLVHPKPQLLGYGLAGLAAPGLLLAFPGVVSHSSPARVFPTTRFVELLKDTGQRIAGSPEMSHWPLAGNSVPQFYSSSGIRLERYAAFTALLAKDPLLIRRTGSTALLLNKEDIQGPFAASRNSLVIATPEHVLDSGTVLFQDNQAEPRARMVYVGRTLAPDSPPPGSALPPLMESGVAPNQPPDPPPSVTIVPTATNSRVRIHVEQERPGVLVLADAWYPGWRATVDGLEKEAFPVDIAFRGVALSEGAHDVEFLYDPLSVELGTYVSAAAGLLVAAGLAVAALTRR